MAAAADGTIAASAGFGGEVKIWKFNSNAKDWTEAGTILESKSKTGELWAVAVTSDGATLAASSYDGRVGLWDLRAGSESSWEKVREYETKGSFGMSVALVSVQWLSVWVGHMLKIL